MQHRARNRELVRRQGQAALDGVDDRLSARMHRPGFDRVDGLACGHRASHFFLAERRGQPAGHFARQFHREPGIADGPGNQLVTVLQCQRQRLAEREPGSVGGHQRGGGAVGELPHRPQAFAAIGRLEMHRAQLHRDGQHAR